jgi:hypothetical protein
MEAIWIIPLYIICPLIGLILFINNVQKIKEKREKFYFGILLICLPIIHLILIEVSQLSINQNIVGSYQLENNTNILIIKEDGTFEMQNTQMFGEAGDGKWEIYHTDTAQINLKFNNNDWLLLNIVKGGNKLELRNNPPQNQPIGILIKQ